MKLVLTPGQSKQIPLEHRYLRVLQTSGDVQVSAYGVNAFVVRNRQIVDLEKPQKITLTNSSATDLTVEIESAPFKITEMDAVDIASLPDITIADGQTVAVGTVDFPQGSEVGIVAGSVIGISANQKIKKDASGSYTGLAPITFDVSAKQVAANAARKELHVKAAIENAELVWVGSSVGGAGIPLAAGESAVFEVSASLDLYCSSLSGKVYLAEAVE